MSFGLTIRQHTFLRDVRCVALQLMIIRGLSFWTHSGWSRNPTILSDFLTQSFTYPPRRVAWSGLYHSMPITILCIQEADYFIKKSSFGLINPPIIIGRRQGGAAATARPASQLCVIVSTE